VLPAAWVLQRHGKRRPQAVCHLRPTLQASRLVATVHARVHLSSEIGVWHDRFHELSEMLIQAEMNEAGIPPERAKSLVKIWVFTVEGLLAHPTSEAEKREIFAVLAGGASHQRTI
jgi:hypothetical protein